MNFVQSVMRHQICYLRIMPLLILKSLLFELGLESLLGAICIYPPFRIFSWSSLFPFHEEKVLFKSTDTFTLTHNG